MTREFAPGRLDVVGFAAVSASISGADALSKYPRLVAELARESDPPVNWKAEGANREGSAGQTVPWLHLESRTCVPLTCQRCLKPVDVDLEVDRWFRFAPDEATAAADDEGAEEDVLVASRDFDLHALIEDELLMEIPATPRHEICPEPVNLSASDPDFDAAEAARPNPFAVLGALRSVKPK